MLGVRLMKDIKNMISVRTMIIIITEDKQYRKAAIDLDLNEDDFRLTIKWVYHCGYRTPEEVKEIFISYAKEGKDIFGYLNPK